MKNNRSLALSFFVIFLLSLSLCTPAMAEDFNIVDNVLIRYSGWDTHVTIPDGVTRIEDRAFDVLAVPLKVTHVTMPDSVTSIGEFAFAGCPNLTEIVFSKNLKRIEQNALANTSLKNVVFSENIEHIGSSVLGNCSKLETVHFFTKTNDVGFGILSGCDQKFDVYAYYGTGAWGSIVDSENLSLHYLDREEISFTLQKNGVVNAWEKNPVIYAEDISISPGCIYWEDLTWTSSNPDVADVIYSQSTGLQFVGYKEGTATITASYGGGSCSREITVINTEPFKLDRSEMIINMAIDEPIPKLIATVHPYYADRGVSGWASTNRSVVTIKPFDPIITPVGVGKADILALYDENFEARCAVTVINDPKDDGIPEDENAGGVFDDEEDFSKEPPVDVPVIIVPPSSSSQNDHILSFDQDKKSNGKNTVVYNIHLRDRHGNEVDLPDECILCFPYPQGLDQHSKNKYRIIIHHYANDGSTEVFKSEDGDIEFTEQGLCIRVRSFSPFEISWEEAPASVSPDHLPSTGDKSQFSLWLALLTMTTAMLMIMKRKTA